jgi:hypothetical protein
MDARKQAVETRRPPGACLAERARNRSEARVRDAQRHQRVEQRRAVVAGAHDRGEVGHRIAAAVPLRARRAQHARHRVDRLELKRIDALLRHHRVEYQPAHVIRVRKRVVLGRVRAVGHAVERPAVDAERGAQLVQVAHRVGRREETTLRANPRRASA